jgi:hypothetical protein
MIKERWEILDCWVVAGYNYRVILKPRTTRAHLIDITLETSNIHALLEEVVNAFWTSQELMVYLDDIAVQGRHSIK